jgi:hypothetical protein
MDYPHHEPTENLLEQLRERGPDWVILQNMESNGRDSITLRHSDTLHMYPNSKILKRFEDLPPET